MSTTAADFLLLDAQGRKLRVNVTASGACLSINVDGYNLPVSLDWHGGDLKVLVYEKPTYDDPKVLLIEPSPE